MLFDVRWSNRRKLCLPPLGSDNDSGPLDSGKGLCSDDGVGGVGERGVIEDQRKKL